MKKCITVAIIMKKRLPKALKIDKKVEFGAQ